MRGWPNSHAIFDEFSQLKWVEILYCANDIPTEVLAVIINTILLVVRKDKAASYLGKTIAI